MGGHRKFRDRNISDNQIWIILGFRLMTWLDASSILRIICTSPTKPFQNGYKTTSSQRKLQEKSTSPHKMLPGLKIHTSGIKCTMQETFPAPNHRIATLLGPLEIWMFQVETVLASKSPIEVSIEPVEAAILPEIWAEQNDMTKTYIIWMIMYIYSIYIYIASFILWNHSGKCW